MPPALSDYDFSSSSECDDSLQGAEDITVGDVEATAIATSTTIRGPLQERTHVNKAASERDRSITKTTTVPVSVASTAPTKRKHSTLLAGLDQNNIITIPLHEDESAPTSSYSTRGTTTGMRANELSYDQKYHPMDEYVRPSQAARVRAKYGEPHIDDDSEATDLDERGETDSEVDCEQLSNKRRKILTFRPSQATRRSSRHVNHNVLYDTNIHPQDQLLQDLDTDSSHDEGTAEEESEINQTVAESVVVSVQEVQEVQDSNADDSASEPSTSSPPRSSPLSSIAVQTKQPSGLNRVGENESVFAIPGRERLASGKPPQTQPFSVHEEPLEVQLAREASAPTPIEYTDDDKENQEAYSEAVSDPTDSITVHAGSELPEIHETIERGLDSILDEFHDPPSMFDQQSDQTEYNDERHHLPIGIVESRQHHGSDYDSVLGAPSPGRSSDIDSVMGEAYQRAPIGGFVLLR